MNPKLPKPLYFFLSLTWGIITTLAGFFTALVMLATGHKPRRWGYAWYFEVGKNWGGASLGPVFIKDRTNDSAHLKNHEFGHSIQNCYFGPLMPFIVGLPSSTRYRLRRFKEKVLKKSPKTPYDAVWFESQASRLGDDFMKWHEGRVK